MKNILRKDLNKLKERLLEKQGWVCAISGKALKLDKEAVVDHKHKLFKNQPIGEDGAGLIRGVLHFQVNAWEGKVFNAFRRMGLHKFDKDMPDMLEELAAYLRKNPTEYIHPSEVPKVKKLGKRIFNKIAKLYKTEYPKRVQLEYPKSGKATKKIKELAKKYEIEL